MAARCAESSVTDCAIVGGGDSDGDALAIGDGEAIGSAAMAFTRMHPKARSAAIVVAVLDLKHRT